ncbi:phosphoketolase family protein [Rhizobium yanglingense]
MLPILHLNGYKIANPTILARASNESDLRRVSSSGIWLPAASSSRGSTSRTDMHARAHGRPPSTSVFDQHQATSRPKAAARGIRRRHAALGR